jgi:hypothetical protein
MRIGSCVVGLLTSLGACLVLIAAGCGPADKGGRQARDTSGGGTAETAPFAQAKEDQKNGREHDSWWCDEHGVPEDVCGQCNPKLAAEFKRKGDWCKNHDRPKSQCFKCDPKLKDKFAAQYRAKYGKEPPAIEEDEKDKKDDKKG